MKQRSYSETNTGSHLVVRRADIFLLQFKYQRQSKTCGWKGEKRKKKQKLAQAEAQSQIEKESIVSVCLFASCLLALSLLHIAHSQWHCATQTRTEDLIRQT